MTLPPLSHWHKDVGLSCGPVSANTVKTNTCSVVRQHTLTNDHAGFLKLLIRSGNLSPMSLPSYQQQTYSGKPPPIKDEAERSEGTQQMAASVTDRTNAIFLLDFFFFSFIFTPNYTFGDRCQWWWTVRLNIAGLDDVRFSDMYHFMFFLSLNY